MSAADAAAADAAAIRVFEGLLTDAQNDRNDRENALNAAQATRDNRLNALNTAKGNRTALNRRTDCRSL